jgi:hypothetical protein
MGPLVLFTRVSSATSAIVVASACPDEGELDEGAVGMCNVTWIFTSEGPDLVTLPSVLLCHDLWERSKGVDARERHGIGSHVC